LNSTLEAVSKSDPDIAAFGTAGVGAVPMPNIPQMASVWTDFGTAWAAVLTGKLKAAPAFTMAAKNIAKLVG
jgi:arabinogalactan oligomer/maltooligosaccharide transport system substrate-binding protein